MLLERKAAIGETQARTGTARATAQPARRTAEAGSPTPRGASSLGRQLDSGEIREDRVPGNVLTWPVDDLTDSQRQRLTELVDSWWPDRPLPELIRKTTTGVDFNNGALAAVCAGAALDLTLSDERWLDVLATAGAMFLQPDVVGWLHRQYRPELDERAAGIIRASDDEWHLYYAIGAFASLSEVVARAFVERLTIVRDAHRFAALVQTLVSAGHRELLGELDQTDLDDGQRQVLLEAQAAAGDAAAQLALVGQARENVRTGQPSPPLRFAHSVTDERLVAPLAELLGLLGPSGSARDELQRSVVQALAATRSVTALRAYDRLMEQRSFESAFFWYPRTELARSMARQSVLQRLPELVADVPAVVEEHGWHPDAA
jgi:hypothetical protein